MLALHSRSGQKWSHDNHEELWVTCMHGHVYLIKGWMSTTEAESNPLESNLIDPETTSKPWQSSLHCSWRRSIARETFLLSISTCNRRSIIMDTCSVLMTRSVHARMSFINVMDIVPEAQRYRPVLFTIHDEMFHARSQTHRTHTNLHIVIDKLKSIYCDRSVYQTTFRKSLFEHDALICLPPPPRSRAMMC
jgi:hypothetical protein